MTRRREIASPGCNEVRQAVDLLLVGNRGLRAVGLGEKVERFLVFIIENRRKSLVHVAEAIGILVDAALGRIRGRHRSWCWCRPCA